MSIINNTITTSGITIISTTPFLFSLNQTKYNFLCNARILSKIGHAIINSMNQLAHRCQTLSKKIHDTELKLKQCIEQINESNNRIAEMYSQLNNVIQQKQV